jgi:hypothetical protein
MAGAGGAIVWIWSSWEGVKRRKRARRKKQATQHIEGRELNV